MDLQTKRETPSAAVPRQEEFAGRLIRLAPAEGTHATAWPGLEVVRADGPQALTAEVYPPSFCVVAQGSKRTRLGGETFGYDPLHYLVLSVPLPVENEVVEASPERPFLGLRLRLRMAELGDLLLNADATADRRCNCGPRRGIYVSPVTDELYDAVLRLVTALEDPAGLKVLGPLAEREVLYRVLIGDQGERVREAVLNDSRSHRIAQVLQYLQENYTQPLDIAAIAEVANMSPSTLHHAFKDVTSTSPVQYLKKIRLHHARRLMLQEGLGVGEAAFKVGYVSQSQFSREYRRLFGTPPSRDVASLRAAAG